LCRTRQPQRMGKKQSKVLTKAKTVNVIAAKVISGVQELLQFE
jgi:hypothetical protein